MPGVSAPPDLTACPPDRFAAVLLPMARRRQSYHTSGRPDGCGVSPSRTRCFKYKPPACAGMTLQGGLNAMSLDALVTRLRRVPWLGAPLNLLLLLGLAALLAHWTWHPD